MSSLVLVTAGRGPAEGRAFAEALARWMHERLPGAELTVGSGSAELLCAADLSPWVGTHELVDALRGRRRRRRWFVALTVHAPAPVGAFDAAQVRFRADRAGGPGGQHVNTTSSAVRATYPPAGLSVRVASERSQHANRRRALVLLRRRFEDLLAEQAARSEQQRWRGHDRVTRGEPVARWRRRRGALVPVELPTVAALRG